MVASLKDAEMQRKLKELGWVIVGNTSQQATERARTDYALLGQVARDIELKPN